jgi:hypothetical protein
MFEVDFGNFIIAGQFGCLSSSSNCWQIFRYLGCPDKESGFHNKYDDMLFLCYEGLQLTVVDDRLRRVTLSLNTNDIDDLPVSFTNLLNEREGNFHDVQQLLQSQKIDWVKNSIVSDEDFEYFSTSRKVDLTFDTRTGTLVYVGFTYEDLDEDEDPDEDFDC